MEMTRTKACGTVSLATIGFMAILAISLATAPLALAASSGSDYKIEIMRAHTVYKNADPKPTVQVGLGVFGNR